MASRPSPTMLDVVSTGLSQEPIRVLIGLGSLMDCQLVKTALKQSRQQMDIVASAVSRTDVLHCFSRGNFHVALINADLEDGGLTGLELLSEIHAAYQSTPVVILFETWRDDLILRAFRAGAKGVFSRSEKNIDMLWKCIAAVHQGQVWANSAQLHLLLNNLVKVAPIRVPVTPGLHLLAQREMEVANLVAEGMPNKEIALKLGITEHTVSNYLFRVYNKLGISNRVELVLYTMKHRISKEET